MARQFIVIEGLIGVGKTSLCRLLSESWGGKLVLEPCETNPFLEPFYRDPARFSFPVQMYYLMTRWKQQEGIRQGDLFSDLVIADYLFEKDRLFAEKTLSPLELDLYDRFAGALGESAPRPDLVVFLDAPIDTILARIAERACPGEDLIERDYLVDLRARYQRLLGSWTQCPVLYLDNTHLNYVADDSVKQSVLSLIRDGLDGRPVPPLPRLDAPGSSLEWEVPPDREAQTRLFSK